MTPILDLCVLLGLGGFGLALLVWARRCQAGSRRRTVLQRSAAGLVTAAVFFAYLCSEVEIAPEAVFGAAGLFIDIVVVSAGLLLGEYAVRGRLKPAPQ